MHLQERRATLVIVLVVIDLYIHQSQSICVSLAVDKYIYRMLLKYMAGMSRR